MKETSTKGLEYTEISLCENCWCMTHTIDGRCGKCKALKRPDVIGDENIGGESRRRR